MIIENSAGKSQKDKFLAAFIDGFVFVEKYIQQYAYFTKSNDIDIFPILAILFFDTFIKEYSKDLTGEEYDNISNSLNACLRFTQKLYISSSIRNLTLDEYKSSVVRTLDKYCVAVLEAGSLNSRCYASIKEDANDSKYYVMNFFNTGIGLDATKKLIDQIIHNQQSSELLPVCVSVRFLKTNLESVVRNIYAALNNGDDYFVSTFLKQMFDCNDPNVSVIDAKYKKLPQTTLMSSDSLVFESLVMDALRISDHEELQYVLAKVALSSDFVTACRQNAALISSFLQVSCIRAMIEFVKKNDKALNRLLLTEDQANLVAMVRAMTILQHADEDYWQELENFPLTLRLRSLTEPIARISRGNVLPSVCYQVLNDIITVSRNHDDITVKIKEPFHLMRRLNTDTVPYRELRMVAFGGRYTLHDCNNTVQSNALFYSNFFFNESVPLAFRLFIIEKINMHEKEILEERVNTVNTKTPGTITIQPSQSILSAADKRSKEEKILTLAMERLATKNTPYFKKYPDLEEELKRPAVGQVKATSGVTDLFNNDILQVSRNQDDVIIVKLNPPFTLARAGSPREFNELHISSDGTYTMYNIADKIYSHQFPYTEFTNLSVKIRPFILCLEIAEVVQHYRAKTNDVLSLQEARKEEGCNCTLI